MRIPSGFNFGGSAPPNIVTNGLVLWLDAGNLNSYAGSGTSWKDISGNSNNGTLTNGPTYSSSNGGAIVFDGSDDYVTVNNSNLPTGALTYEFWVRVPTSFTGVPKSSLGYAMIFSTSQYYAYLAIFKDDSAYSFAWDTSSNINRFGSLSTGQWYQVCLVRSTTQATGYVNAVESTAVADTTTLSGSFEIGRWAYDSTPRYYYNESIAIGRVYNRALSLTEITQNFNAQRKRFGL
jgi:hypothetical protein